MKCVSSLLIGLILLLQAGLAQNAPQSESAPRRDKSTTERTEALRQVIEPLRESSQELEKLRKLLKSAGSEEARKLIQSQMDAESERLGKLRANFRSIIGGAEAAEYDGTTQENLSLNHLMVDLLAPLSRAVRDASASPRELEILRENLAQWEQRKSKCDLILQRIENLQATMPDKELKDEFEATRRLWEGRRAESRSQIGVLKAQIKDREGRQRPLLETLSESISAFFRIRGLNLVLAVISGVAAFLLTRRLYHFAKKYSPLHRSRTSLASRLVDVIAGLLSVLFALWSVMLVFYVRGDWLLLTLVVLFLIGAVWAGKTSLPPYFEQVRTLLNLGSIREGERVIYQGLPFRVRSLGFLTILDNPRLQGGEYRIPVRHVMGMISRQPDDKEPWFPTEEDNWVLMADETYGKVITQTPEQVVLLKLGGSLKTYSTAEFLEGTPENLSRGYRMACTFGIDYKHQKIATGEVAEVFERAIMEAIYSKFDNEDIRSVQVEFKEAGSSSLDYQINIDVSGNLDSRYQYLFRFVQKVCVDTCNERGWVIPFTQITVHQAQPV